MKYNRKKRDLSVAGRVKAITIQWRMDISTVVKWERYAPQFYGLR